MRDIYLRMDQLGGREGFAVYVAVCMIVGVPCVEPLFCRMGATSSPGDLNNST